MINLFTEDVRRNPFAVYDHLRKNSRQYFTIHPQIRESLSEK
jgi:hypothetical protein